MLASIWKARYWSRRANKEQCNSVLPIELRWRSTQCTASLVLKEADLRRLKHISNNIIDIKDVCYTRCETAFANEEDIVGLSAEYFSIGEFRGPLICDLGFISML